MSLASRNYLLVRQAAKQNTNSIAIALQTTIQTKRASSFPVFCTFPKEQVAFKMTQFPPPLRDHLRRDSYLKLDTFLTKPENILNNYISCSHLLEIPPNPGSYSVLE